MRAPRVWSPVEPDYSAKLLHSALKLAPNLYLPDFRKQAIEQKVRRQDLTRFLHSELRHLGSFIREWFCITLQI